MERIDVQETGTLIEKAVLTVVLPKALVSIRTTSKKEAHVSVEQRIIINFLPTKE